MRFSTLNEPKLEHCNNKIRTSKYTIWNFIFLNIYEQFSFLTNWYYLLIFQCIPQTTITGGTPTIAGPFSFILFITAMKNLWEDVKKVRSDKAENKSHVQIFNNNDFQAKDWQDIRVGNIIKIYDGQIIPADILLLTSANIRGDAYISSKALDGETNFKLKVSNKDIYMNYQTSQDFITRTMTLQYSEPDSNLNKIKAKATLNNKDKKLKLENFIFRGCLLKNTEYIYGLVIYTGPETKIMKNSIKALQKKSKIQKQLDKIVLSILIGVVVYCSIAATMYTEWKLNNEISVVKQIDDKTGSVLLWFASFGRWVQVMGNMVPISLVVTLDFVKLMQGIVIGQDKNMSYAKEIKDGEFEIITADVNQSGLNEELGQISYVFSDKTGTLTCNKMDFKQITIQGQSYGEQKDQLQNMPEVTNVDFKDAKFIQLVNDQDKYTMEALKCIGLCHNIIAYEQNNKLLYNHQSPDELALVNFAKYVGLEFRGKNNQNNVILRKRSDGQELQFSILQVFDFDSDRKRMSVVVQDLQKKQKFIYIKGADNIIKDRLNKSIDCKMGKTQQYLDEYCEKGLRTLALAFREISEEEYIQWEKEYNDTIGKHKPFLQDKLESNLELIGITAIEDSLQDQVPETIKALKDAQIKVWVLTGDKTGTAISIAKSCNLLTNEEQINLEKEDKDPQGLNRFSSILMDQMSRQNNLEIDLRQKLDSLKNNNNALILTGSLLTLAFSKDDQSIHKKIQDVIFDISEKCKVVIACRVSPEQKQQLVNLVKQRKKNETTLSIGDGANDVAMITAAQVGIGIRGQEGNQAARASDYSIGEFKLLRYLLFCYGRECYRRNTNVIEYCIYKNIILVLPQIWFAFNNAFSCQTLYEKWSLQLYNIPFTMFPILAYGIFDTEMNYKILHDNYKYYRLGKENQLFTYKRILLHFLHAVIESLIILFVCLHSLSNIYFNPQGDSYDLMAMGCMVFGVVVFVSNIKILVISYSYYGYILLSVFLSIASYGIFLWFITNLQFIQIYKMFNGLIISRAYHLGNILCIICTNGFDLAIKQICDYAKHKEITNNFQMKKSLLNNSIINRESNDELSSYLVDSQTLTDI